MEQSSDNNSQDNPSNLVSTSEALPGEVLVEGRSQACVEQQNKRAEEDMKNMVDALRRERQERKELSEHLEQILAVVATFSGNGTFSTPALLQNFQGVGFIFDLQIVLKHLEQHFLLCIFEL